MEVMISLLKVGHLKKYTNEFSTRKTAALEVYIQVDRIVMLE